MSRSNQAKKMGMNKTGIDMSPIDSKALMEGAKRLTQAPPGDELAVAQNRTRYAAESDRIGSVPVPGTIRGAVQGGVQLIQGNDPAFLIDKLGARLAFERTGVRLYDALISKHSAAPDPAILPPLERLWQIRDEEHEHFMRVAEVIRRLGADPTAMTPAADVTAVMSMGLVQVAGEPRMSFMETLEAILAAELVDNDCWGLLVSLTESAGLKDVADQFRRCLAQEQEHLESVREWVRNLATSASRAAKKAA